MKSDKKQKLELTWIGKDAELKLEPRILIEDPNKSYGDPSSENMLIQGDNLLALKALQQDFTSKIKCIYIDPPFNTGTRINADGIEIGYDDGLEHSIWMNMMSARLAILKTLLKEEGSIFIHIDDTEIGYLIVLCDEIFGRKNRIQIITNKRGSVTGHKAINPGMVNITDFILVYAKNKDKWEYHKLYKSRERNERYNNFIKNKNQDESKWEIISLLDAFAEHKNLDKKDLKRTLGELYEEQLNIFVMDNAQSVIQLAYPDYKNVSKEAQKLIDISKNDQTKFYHLQRENYLDIYLYKGQRLLFYSDRLFEIDGKLVGGEPLSNLWDDILPNDLHNEGQVTFRKGKKPEKLIKRILELATEPEDYVLDSFAGSGTTGAAAHKMNRKWIMCELSVQSETHIIPRLRRVIKGEDKSGITKDTNWKIGGGFKFYNLAPSLLRKDSFGNFIIDEKYNANMLAAAVCKHEGFKYSPDEANYWKQGKSTETDYIFVTTGFVTVEQLDAIHAQMKEDDSLLICAKAFAPGIENHYPNITVKKIPQMILGKCEFGKDNYDLNIIKTTGAEAEESDEVDDE